MLAVFVPVAFAELTPLLVELVLVAFVVLPGLVELLEALLFDGEVLLIAAVALSVITEI